MALSPNYQQAVFIEIFDKESPMEANRRYDVTTLTDEKRNEQARSIVARLDNDYLGVRLARVTVETLTTYA